MKADTTFRCAVSLQCYFSGDFTADQHRRHSENQRQRLHADIACLSTKLTSDLKATLSRRRGVIKWLDVDKRVLKLSPKCAQYVAMAARRWFCECCFMSINAKTLSIDPRDPDVCAESSGSSRFWTGQSVATLPTVRDIIYPLQKSKLLCATSTRFCPLQKSKLLCATSTRFVYAWEPEIDSLHRSIGGSWDKPDRRRGRLPENWPLLALELEKTAYLESRRNGLDRSGRTIHSAAIIRTHWRNCVLHSYVVSKIRSV